LKLPVLIWTILLISCTNKPASEAAPDTISGENFDEFFETFKSDSLFQINRVKFPWAIPSEDGEELVINKSDWQHASFFYQEDFATRPIDAYTQEIRTYGDTVKIELRGVDNGNHIDFLFAKIDNKWFLVSEEDLSN